MIKSELLKIDFIPSKTGEPLVSLEFSNIAKYTTKQLLSETISIENFMRVLESLLHYEKNKTWNEPAIDDILTLQTNKTSVKFVCGQYYFQVKTKDAILIAKQKIEEMYLKNIITF